MNGEDIEKLFVRLMSGRLDNQAREQALAQLLEALLTNQEKQEVIQDPGTLDCQKCGVCCLPDKPQLGSLAWVTVFEKELQAMGPELAEKFTEPDHGMLLADLGIVQSPVDNMPGVGAVRLMRTKVKDGQVMCKALTGTPGKACSCAVYSTAPRICKAVEKGSLSCLAYRRQYQHVLYRHLERLEV